MRFPLQDKTKWHGKFLWWPRVVDGQLVWLESVWRKREWGRFDFSHYSYYDYKLTVPTETSK